MNVLDSDRPLLITGATLIGTDPVARSQGTGDVLIADGKIAAIGLDLPRSEHAQVLDATGKILLPGLVDAHQHTWQHPMRGVGADWSLVDYFSYQIFTFKKHYTPEDIYAGTLLGATEALTNGSTTMADWSDGAATPEHAEAAVQALTDAGIRGRFTYANAGVAAQDWALGPHVKQLWDRLGDFDQLVSMQLAVDSGLDPAFPERPVWEFARDNGIRIATHGGLFGWDQSMWVPRLSDNGFLLPTTMYMHMVSIPDEFVKRVADTGGTIVNAPIGNMGQGQGFPHVLTARRFGANIALATNSEARYATSVFDVMRTEANTCALYGHLAAEARGYLQPMNEVRSADLLHYATMGGAKALGLDDRIGSLTVGKTADLVLMTPDPMAMPARLDPVGHVVSQGRAELLDLVLVAGKVMRQNGNVVRGVPHDKVRALVNASQERLIAAVGEDAMAAAASRPARPDALTMRNLLD